MRRRRLALLFLVLAQGALALGQDQTPFTAEDEAVARRVWLRILAQASAKPDYKKLVDAWLSDAEVVGRLGRREVREWFVAERKRDPAANAAAEKVAAAVDPEMARDQARLARSMNAAASNPRKVGLLERGGIVDRVAVALEGTKLVNADDTAATVNLGAAALLVKCSEGTGTRTYEYECGARKRLKNLGGSVTFGAKLPAAELTGFSGFPDADKLFDALSWDVKLRLMGDRDPRAEKWREEIITGLGVLRGKAAALPSYPETPDDARPQIAAYVQEGTEAATRRTLRRIKQSFQVSLKASGQHLTNEKGMNKYAVTLLVDKGFGVFDGSLNASYSVVQDASMGATVFDLKQWKVTAGFAGTVLEDALVSGRGSELTLSAEVLVPNDGSGVPVDRKTVWKADAALTFPVTDSAQVPVSVTFTNDPNNLAKQRFVRGQIGINYDLGSLKDLLRRK